MNHFENIWNEAESLCSLTENECLDHLLKKIYDLKTSSREDKKDHLSKILLLVSNLSLLYEVNVAAALQKEIDNIKIENLE